MKLSLLFVSLVALVGCAHNAEPPKTPSPPPPNCEVTYISNPTGAKIQGQMVEGSTWVWNKTTQAWEWVTSEEVKTKVREYYDSAKKKWYDD